MKRLVYATAALLMLAGIYAGANQPKAALNTKHAIVVADGTAPIPLCDPSYQNCPPISGQQ